MDLVSKSPVIHLASHSANGWPINSGVRDEVNKLEDLGLIHLETPGYELLSNTIDHSDQVIENNGEFNYCASAVIREKFPDQPESAKLRTLVGTWLAGAPDRERGRA
ncbi:hypothetical protein KQX54_016099 [Cotesia glomerata]|uniref:Uncharacterized protein n=1 Tax=Cotesia glomerata TaxID=32391 RepID=A0AAV7IF73_COTGL|nr:hypothetical protein KQX54_016099 [Cotesia glomerata]